MKSILRRNAPLFYALAAMLALYVPWLNRGFNNFEYPFVSAGRALAFANDADLIEAYWPAIANPLGYSFVLSLIYRIIGFNDAFWVSRTPALFGAGLVLISGWVITKSMWRERQYLFYIWSALLLLQPMFVVFSTSGTTDLLPVGLLMLSVSIALRSQDNGLLTKIAIGLLFGLATIIKYNTAYFGLALIVGALYRPQKLNINIQQKVKDLMLYILIPGFVLCWYLYWCYRSYGVFISSRLQVSEPNFFDLRTMSKNFVKYLSFFGLFFASLPVIFVFNKSKRSQLKKFDVHHVAVIVAIIAGWHFSGVSSGELDFGRFFDESHRILLRVAESIGAALGLCALLVMIKISKSSSKIKTTLLCGSIPYLVLISASYPSQRYLTFVIPGSLILLVDAIQILTRRFQAVIIGSSMVVFAAVSLLGMSYLTSQGNASEDMAVWVEENDLISQTSAGAIAPHAGQHFWGITKTEVRYEIIAVTPATEAQIKERVLHREPMKVLGKVTRVYLLREVPVSP